MYDHSPLPPTQKQLDYARAIARRLDMAIPRDNLETRQSLSRWIDAHRAGTGSAPGATSRQVAYAEKIARIKRRAIPEECFRDSGLMSRWIDANR
ncbi:hypothetical protein [Sinisalibacter aestuarii]|uniref:Integrase n=1 Tax=Sinisalibacter aestuarii TaxID=2949426 RepID=A0ABQ5LSB9_9RHOB|nr:hypothetical protein [Sinisalibacter aestuarii]GKY87201.1 hypothetical protein STA1M1_10700 [Sinisalibacter aestuarii]